MLWLQVKKFLPWVITIFIVVNVGFIVEGVLSGRSHNQFNVTSFSFVVLAAACGALRSRYGLLVQVGLVFCALADSWLADPFHLKALAFVVAHVFFIGAFLTRKVSINRLMFSTPLIMASLLVLVCLWPYVWASDRVLVSSYVGVITGMVIMACATAAGPAGRVAMVAALLFYISDIFVARIRYVSSDWINQVFCYALYYAACTGFAWSTFRLASTGTSQDSKSIETGSLADIPAD